MGRHVRQSQAHQNGPQESQRCESIHHHSSINHAIRQSTYDKQVRHNEAYTQSYDYSAAYEYAQELDLDGHCPNAPSQQRTTPSRELYYDQVSRSWTHINPKVRQVVNNPFASPGYTASPVPTYQQDSSRSRAMEVEKRRPTHSKLGILGYTTAPTSSMAIWQQQDQRKGPWNGVGYVRSDEPGR